MQLKKSCMWGKKISFLRQKFFVENKADVVRQALNLVAGELAGVSVQLTCELVPVVDLSVSQFAHQEIGDNPTYLEVSVR